jgi:hypothetical protein
MRTHREKAARRYREELEELAKGCAHVGVGSLVLFISCEGLRRILGLSQRRFVAMRG